MPNDAYTLSFLSKELNETLKNGKINKIHQPNSGEILLNVYAENITHKLLISAGNFPRMHLTESVKDNPLTSFNFLMNLRKHINNAEIIKISSIPYERIIEVELLSKNELRASETYFLYAELMGKYSNIILVKDHKILSAMKTVSLDSARPVFSGLEYCLPSQNNYCLSEIDKIKEKLNENFEENLEDYLCKILRGISKTTANEIIFLSKVPKKLRLSKADIENLVKTIEKFDGMSKENLSSPCLIYNGTTDVYPFEYKSLGGKIEKFQNLSEAFDTLYSKKDILKTINEQGKDIRQVLKNNIAKLTKKIKILSEKLEECSEKEKFKIYGDLIMSNIHKIPNNTEICKCQNFFEDNKEIEIKLDKKLSPSKNAQIYYKKYNKLKTAQTHADSQLKQAKDLIEYFYSIEYALNDCSETTEISEIAEELKKEGFLTETKSAKKPKSKEIFRPASYKVSGFSVYAGKNNLQNDYLTFKMAKPGDIWLHVKNNHGSHVVILTENKTVPENVIKTAAEIAGFYSREKESSKAEVDYTFKKHVKKPTGAKPGFVTYTDYKTIIITPKQYDIG